MVISVPFSFGRGEGFTERQSMDPFCMPSYHRTTIPSYHHRSQRMIVSRRIAQPFSHSPSPSLLDVVCGWMNEGLVLEGHTSPRTCKIIFFDPFSRGQAYTGTHRKEKEMIPVIPERSKKETEVVCMKKCFAMCLFCMPRSHLLSSLYPIDEGEEDTCSSSLKKGKQMV